MILHVFCLIVLLNGVAFSVISGNKNCFSERTPSIPKCHIYHEKKLPIVLGHRGNPMYYQENSLAGLKSLRRHGADGFEIDVFLTKDKKLICFHDENAKKLTGVNRKIIDMTSEEIKCLRYKKEIKYGSNTYFYTARRKVVFLDKVLRWAKYTNLLVYIEMKPSNPIHKDMAAIQHSIETGKAVAKMVKAFGMVNQVFVNSYDILKTHTAKKVEKNLVIGTAYIKNFWFVPPSIYNKMKYLLIRFFPSLAPCLSSVQSNNSKFIEFLYLNGVLEKSLNAALTDIDLIMYDNPTFGTNNTIQTLKTNYNWDFAIGAYTVYSMEENSIATKALEPKIDDLIKQGVSFFMTDDVPRLIRKIKEYKLKCLKKVAMGDVTDEDTEDTEDMEAEESDVEYRID